MQTRAWGCGTACTCPGRLQGRWGRWCGHKLPKQQRHAAVRRWSGGNTLITMRTGRRPLLARSGCSALAPEAAPPSGPSTLTVTETAVLVPAGTALAVDQAIPHAAAQARALRSGESRIAGGASFGRGRGGASRTSWRCRRAAPLQPGICAGQPGYKHTHLSVALGAVL